MNLREDIIIITGLFGVYIGVLGLGHFWQIAFWIKFLVGLGSFAAGFAIGMIIRQKKKP